MRPQVDPSSPVKRKITNSGRIYRRDRRHALGDDPERDVVLAAEASAREAVAARHPSATAMTVETPAAIRVADVRADVVAAREQGVVARVASV